MKLNRKGFMMAEVIVVSSVVLIILTTLYISYNKIFSLYETRLNYEDSNLIYALSYYRDYLNEPGTTKMAVEMQKIDMGHTYYSVLTNSGGALAPVRVALNTQFSNMSGLDDTVYLVQVDGHPLDPEKINVNDPGFKEYIEYLQGTDLLAPNGSNASYIMILKRKDLNTNESKYAYLVVN